MRLPALKAVWRLLLLGCGNKSDPKIQRAGRPENICSIPRRGRKIVPTPHCFQTGYEAHPASYQCVRGFSVRGLSGRDVKLNIHLRPVPRIRIRGFIPPLPGNSSWNDGSLRSGTTLPLSSISGSVSSIATWGRDATAASNPLNWLNRRDIANTVLNHRVPEEAKLIDSQLLKDSTPSSHLISCVFKCSSYWLSVN
jgi:hypothetical protein